MTDETAAKKDTQRLQRAIVDGLEDVKAQDIQVYNTEHLSPLFERVIIATGSSNRQTKALAASVRDAVREAGFPKPRIEGEENGEWIIVDCGAAVAHVMQPAIRTYYHLEEIWGDKPVRLKFGAAKPAVAQEPEPEPKKAGKKKGADDGPSIRRASAAKTAVKAAEQAAREAKAKPAPRKSAPGRPASGRSAAAKPAAKKSPSRGAPGKGLAGKSSITKVQVGKPAPRKTAASKSPAGKPAAKKTASRAPSRKA